MTHERVARELILEISGGTADELRQYDERLQDVRSSAEGRTPLSSATRRANRLRTVAVFMWSSKLAPSAPNGRLAHDTGRGST